MVDFVTNRLNNARQLMLIFGIVAVGLSNLVITSYINHKDDLSTSLAALQTAAHMIDRADVASSTLPLFSDRDSMATPAEPIVDKRKRRKMAFHPAVTNYRLTRPIVASLPTSIAHISVPAVDCTTTTFPFVGENYVVRVTDPTGCMSLSSMRYRKDRLLAKVLINKKPTHQ